MVMIMRPDSYRNTAESELHINGSDDVGRFWFHVGQRLPNPLVSAQTMLSFKSNANRRLSPSAKTSTSAPSAVG